MRIKIKRASVPPGAPEPSARVQPLPGRLERLRAAHTGTPAPPRGPFAPLLWTPTPLDATWTSEPRFAHAKGFYRVGTHA